MKIWEIAKAMSENKYTIGQIFQNEDYNDLIISDNGELVNNDEDEDAIGILIDDDDEWEAL